MLVLGPFQLQNFISKVLKVRQGRHLLSERDTPEIEAMRKEAAVHAIDQTICVACNVSRVAAEC